MTDHPNPVHAITAALLLKRAELGPHAHRWVATLDHADFLHQCLMRLGALDFGRVPEEIVAKNLQACDAKKGQVYAVYDVPGALCATLVGRPLVTIIGGEGIGLMILLAQDVEDEAAKGPPSQRQPPIAPGPSVN